MNNEVLALGLKRNSKSGWIKSTLPSRAGPCLPGVSTFSLPPDFSLSPSPQVSHLTCSVLRPVARVHYKHCFSACCFQRTEGTPLDRESEVFPSQYHCQLNLSSRIEASSSHSGKHFIPHPGAVLTFALPSVQRKRLFQVCFLDSTLDPATCLIPSASPQYPSFLSLPTLASHRRHVPRTGNRAQV